MSDIALYCHVAKFNLDGPFKCLKGHTCVVWTSDNFVSVYRLFMHELVTLEVGLGVLASHGNLACYVVHLG